MSRFSSVVAFVLAIGALACGIDKTPVSPPPPPPPPTSSQPNAVSVVSGDSQVGAFNSALSAPLVVVVTNSAGDRLPNVKVNWGINGGGGSLSATSTTTDQDGHASVTWTLGPSPNVGQSVGVWTDVEAVPKIFFSAKAEAPLILHFDGTTWARSFMTPNYNNTINTGWTASPSFSFAAGYACPTPFTLQFTNGAWTGDDSCEGAPVTVTSMAGTSANDVWAVATGRGARLIDPDITEVFHFDGNAPSVAYREDDGSHAHSLLGVAARAGEVFAVGLGGRVLHFTGTQWTAQTSGTTSNLLASWADPSTANAFAVGTAGTIIEYNGTTWQTQPSGTSVTLAGVWGSAANDVFAVGDAGTILHFDGASWSAQSSGTTHYLRGIWGASPTSVFAVGDGGAVLRYDGSRWAPLSTGFQMDFTGVWGSSPSNVFVSGR